MNEFECSVCGGPEGKCHPNCPNFEVSSEEPDFFRYLNGIIMTAADEFFVRNEKKVAKQLVVERMKQFQEDWDEITQFVQAGRDAGVFRKIEDILFFLHNPDKYKPLYLIWLELEKPQKDNKADFNLFKLEALNRRK